MHELGENDLKKRITDFFNQKTAINDNICDALSVRSLAYSDSFTTTENCSAERLIFWLSPYAANMTMVIERFKWANHWL